MTIIKTSSDISPRPEQDAPLPGKERGERALPGKGTGSKPRTKNAGGAPVPAAPRETKTSIEEVKVNENLNRRSTLLSCQESSADLKSEQAVRPDRLGEYIGQTRLKSMLSMSINAAKSRGEAVFVEHRAALPVDHALGLHRLQRRAQLAEAQAQVGLHVGPGEG
ncbi:MAG TPA: hypothetical protein PKH78_14080, partial [Candidatus Obscuribacter sp.]|nr:hypothetical protein [Candidatus Obscuribacter sp.]